MRFLYLMLKTPVMKQLKTLAVNFWWNLERLKMADEDKVADIVSSFTTYEDFLDSQITQQDLFYLEDEELGRQLVELGYRGNGELLKGPRFINSKSWSWV